MCSISTKNGIQERLSHSPRIGEDEAKKSSATRVSIFHALPPEVRKRLRALKKIQFEIIKNEINFYHELHRLEYNNQEITSKIFKKRRHIVKGKKEPSEKDCDFDINLESPDDEDPVILAEREKFSLTKKFIPSEKGIPGFWLCVLKSGEFTSDLITKNDEPILEFLVDVRVVLSEELDFSVELEFAKCPYFKNRVLRKEFRLRCELPESRWWAFDGPEVVGTVGCTIDWHPGMDVTSTVSEKMSISWVEGKGKVVHPQTKTSRTDSFFNFFDTLPERAEEGEEPALLNAQLDYIRNMELMLGLYFREDLVPKAVLYYTGDLL